MAHQATPAAPARTRPLFVVLSALTASRLAVLLAAALAAGSLSHGPPSTLGETNRQAFDAPALTRPLDGPLGDLVSATSRWDAVWFLGIAARGYQQEAQAAFFPLYPLLVAGAGELGGGSPAARLIAAQLISLAALAGALLLLYRLAELELGERRARIAVLLCALFPGSFSLVAPYSESLFLFFSVGAFLAAREGRWAWAGAAMLAASATRSTGALLVIPLAIMLLYGPRGDRPDVPERRGWRPRHRPGREALWLLAAPLGIGAYACWLAIELGEPLAFVTAQQTWTRDFALLPVGIWDGAREAWHGAGRVLEGVDQGAAVGPLGGPVRLALMQVGLFGWLVFAIVAIVGLARRLPPAYAAWAAAALALPLSFPADTLALMSLPRYLAVIFPLFMWLAVVCDRRRLSVPVLALFAAGLVLTAAEFGAWHFVG